MPPPTPSSPAKTPAKAPMKRRVINIDSRREISGMWDPDIVALPLAIRGSPKSKTHCVSGQSPAAVVNGMYDAWHLSFPDKLASPSDLRCRLGRDLYGHLGCSGRIRPDHRGLRKNHLGGA